jgi:ABC-type amino acid transport substrate-binding protein
MKNKSGNIYIRIKTAALAVLMLASSNFCLANAQISSPNDTILKIGSMEFPLHGFIDDDGRQAGLFYDFLTEVASRSGLTFENTLMPYRRTISKLKSGEVNMLISTYNEPAQDAGEPLSYLWSYQYILVPSKNSDITTIEDLRGKSFIYIGQGTQLELKGLPGKIHRVKTMEQALQLLKRRPNIEATLGTERTYDYLLKKLGYTREDFGSVIPLQEVREEWVFVDRNMPQEIREKLKQATQEVLDDKFFETLLDKYNAIK